MNRPEPTTRNRWRRLLGVPTLVAAAVVVTALSAFGAVEERRAGDSVNPSSAPGMIERVLPSVVNVRVTKVVGLTQSGLVGERAAEGSGVVLSDDGLVVTNNHVVADAVSVRVVFTDGRGSLPGTVVGTDPAHDLAVVRVRTSGLRPIELARSSGVLMGTSVYAIGFPLDLGPSVTGGIVSGLNRVVDVRDAGQVHHLVGLLQTDAAVNPGNSGGALVDAYGRLVGIPTAAAVASGAQNVGFAIAVDEVMPVVDRIVASPTQRPAWLGVQTVTVDSPAAAAAAHLPADARGVLVVDVLAGSPAAQANLRGGDLVTSVDGTPVRTTRDLYDEVSARRPGQTVVIGLRTGQGSRQVRVRLGEQPPD